MKIMWIGRGQTSDLRKTFGLHSGHTRKKSEFSEKHPGGGLRSVNIFQFLLNFFIYDIHEGIIAHQTRLPMYDFHVLQNIRNKMQIIVEFIDAKII